MHLLADDDFIAFEDPFALHAVTGNTEHEVGAATNPFGGERNSISEVLLGEDWCSCYDATDARYACDRGLVFADSHLSMASFDLEVPLAHECLKVITCRCG